jgi:3-oxoacyl-[acyl-carrier protein] reductase
MAKIVNLRSVMVDHQHVLITGGQGDLARALARTFAANGCQVYAPGRDELDVRSAESVDRYFAGLAALDVLVHNAALLADGPAISLSPAQWENVIAPTLTGGFLCVRAAVRLMAKQRRGHVILIGSRAAIGGTRGQSNYAAAKAGLIGLAQSVAREYGRRNIRCNVICPGYLETKINRHLPAERVAAIRADHVLERFNTPEAAAAAIVFISRLEHVSGQVFQLDSRIDPWT